MEDGKIDPLHPPFDLLEVAKAMAWIYRLSIDQWMHLGEDAAVDQWMHLGEHAYWSLVALAGGSEADPACDTAPDAAFGVIRLFMVSTCSMFWPLQIHHILGPEGTLWVEKKIIPRQMSPWDTSLIWTGDGPLLDGKAVPKRAVRLC